MTFGYIGYIWAMSGCCVLGGVFGGGAAVLYAYGRRLDRQRGAPAVTVERVDSQDGPGPGNAA
ncbi:MAG: hypothetical protein U0234_18855 [Sandaracinus sp.]